MVILIAHEPLLVGVLHLVALILRVHVEVQGLQVRPRKAQLRQQILDLLRVLGRPAEGFAILGVEPLQRQGDPGLIGLDPQLPLACYSNGPHGNLLAWLMVIV